MVFSAIDSVFAQVRKINIYHFDLKYMIKNSIIIIAKVSHEITKIMQFTHYKLKYLLIYTQFFCLHSISIPYLFHYMLTIAYIILGYWLVLSLLAYYNVKQVLTYFRNLPQIQIKQQWKGFIRDDLGKWNQKQIIKGCFMRFPYHLTILGSFLISFVVLNSLSEFFGKGGQKNLIKFGKMYGNFAIRNFMNIIEQQDYRNYQIQTPIVISNHVNWFDIWFIQIVFLPLSIVSKISIKKTPILGKIGDFLDAIYVERSSENQRDSVIQKITERVVKFSQNKEYHFSLKISKLPSQRTNPLIIFPEGTTSNGRSILTFKLGAFNDRAPITMFALNYKCKQFSMGMGDISQAQHVFLSLCLKPTLQVRHKVMEAKKDQSAQDYCKRCRQEMGAMTGFPLVESRYRDYLEYEKAISQAIKSGQENQKNQ